jgi:Fe/S biogenesis protein NfuA
MVEARRPPITLAQNHTMSDHPTLLRVTPEALSTVTTLREEEGDAQALGLWLEVSGVNGAEYSYDLYFESLSDAAMGDVVEHHGELAIVVSAASVDKLRGATLDLRDGGLVLVNPNRPTPPPGAFEPRDLSSEDAQAVLRVLNEEINPSIASHGGFAELVAVEDGTAYLRLGGGCQGCGMAKVTLSQGIEVAIRDAVPAIVNVVDVTDHASGANPYFEQAKK